jgi:tetratricopeptide (TPR) repeat protein
MSFTFVRGTGGAGVILLLGLALALGGAPGVLAQVGPSGLEPIRELPAEPEVVVCEDILGSPRPDPPSEEDRAQAASLAQEAGQAVILGDRERARTLLAGAAALDPTNTDIALRLARLDEETDRTEAARIGFCRVLLLAPDGPDRDEAEERARALTPEPPELIPAPARAAFGEGLRHLDAERFTEAVREFTRALVEFPEWAPAYHNRGLALVGDGRTQAARLDLERYLELEPGSPRRAAIEAAFPEDVPVEAEARYSSATTFLVGAVLPGMGHFYTDRPGRGLLVVAGAGGAAAAGVLFTRLEVECLSIPGPDGCPEGDILEERETRPYLGAGLGAAAAITLGGALHAVLTRPRGSGGSGDGSSAMFRTGPAGPFESASLRAEPARGPNFGAVRFVVDLRF